MSARVLVVDDEPLITASLQEIMEDEGYEVVTASDGVDALQVLRMGPAVDLALVDLRMPRMSGAELIRQIRADDELSHIMVIVITASTIELESLPDTWYQALVPKPFDVLDLITRVKGLLQPLTQ